MTTSNTSSIITGACASVTSDYCGEALKRLRDNAKLYLLGFQSAVVKRRNGLHQKKKPGLCNGAPKRPSRKRKAIPSVISICCSEALKRPSPQQKAILWY